MHPRRPFCEGFRGCFKCSFLTFANVISEILAKSIVLNIIQEVLQTICQMRGRIANYLPTHLFGEKRRNDISLLKLYIMY